MTEREVVERENQIAAIRLLAAQLASAASLVEPECPPGVNPLTHMMVWQEMGDELLTLHLAINAAASRIIPIGNRYAEAVGL